MPMMICRSNYTFMTHEESRLQQQCVAWFRAQYPHYAMLLTHPANEGNGNRISGAIHKAEGTVAGVPDLLLFLPSYIPSEGSNGHVFTAVHGLGIEMKTDKGIQSSSQKDYQRLFQAAGYYYQIVRSLEDFKNLIETYMSLVHPARKYEVREAHIAIEEEKKNKERDKFLKTIKKYKAE